MRKRNRWIRLIAVTAVIALLAGSQTWAAEDPGDGFKAVSSHMAGAVKVKAGKIYASPSTKAAVVKTLPFAAKVATLRQKGSWYYVTYKSYEGYMNKAQVVKYNKSKKHIALTFDDGPRAGTTNTVLNALERNGCRATFFVVGNCVNRKTRKLLTRQKALGCEIGNHSWSHPRLTRGGAAKQLSRTDKIVKSVTGSKPALCRAPYGEINKGVLKVMNRPHIMWSVDTLAWKHRNTATLISKVRKQKRDGAVILMHDIHKPTARGVDAICKDLVKSGYETVTVTELAAINGKSLKAGRTYRSFRK